VLESLGKLTKLKELNLGDCGRWDDSAITDDGLLSLSRLSHLQSLDLSQCSRITDAGLVHLAGLPALRALDLGGADAITDRGLAALGQMRSLEELSFGFTSAMTGARVHSACSRMPALRKLRILARIPDALTDDELSAIVDLPDLRALSLWYASRITAAGLRGLSRLPAIESIEAYSCKKLSQKDADRLLQR
jgi:hypothetical protein